MLIILSIACLCVFAVPALGGDAGLKPKHTLDPSHKSTLYYTEVIIPHGKQFEASCPREQPFDKTDAYKEVQILGGRYSSDFANNGTATCKDSVITKDLAAQCKVKSKCTVSAKDTSSAADCSKRALRLRYTCKNPAARQVMIWIIVDE